MAPVRRTFVSDLARHKRKNDAISNETHFCIYRLYGVNPRPDSWSHSQALAHRLWRLLTLATGLISAGYPSGERLMLGLPVRSPRSMKLRRMRLSDEVGTVIAMFGWPLSFPETASEPHSNIFRKQESEISNLMLPHQCINVSMTNATCFYNYKRPLGTPGNLRI